MTRPFASLDLISIASIVGLVNHFQRLGIECTWIHHESHKKVLFVQFFLVNRKPGASI